MSRSLAILAVLLFFKSSVAAGTLDDFESGVKRTKPKRSRAAGRHADRHSSRKSDNKLGNLAANMIADVYFYGLTYGGISSWDRVTKASSSFMGSDLTPRKTGQTLLPFVRADASYQYVRSDVKAIDYSVDAGYGPFGIRFNQTHFKEDSPDDDLDLYRLYALYRMSFGSWVEVDAGGGALIIDGNNRVGRFSFTLPILFHPCEFVGIEFRPAWAANFQEYDLCLLSGLPYASVKLGYRWTISPSETLNGPYAGLSLHF